MLRPSRDFSSPPRLWWRRSRSQRLLPCLQAVWAAWATWTINRFTQATARFGRPPALGGLSFDDQNLRGERYGASPSHYGLARLVENVRGGFGRRRRGH